MSTQVTGSQPPAGKPEGQYPHEAAVCFVVWKANVHPVLEELREVAERKLCRWGAVLTTCTVHLCLL